jgi:DMSO/TMAO reductase YedYZ heme-binding membrane subunit
MKITEPKKFFVWPYMNELAFKTIFLTVTHIWMQYCEKLIQKMTYTTIVGVRLVPTLRV